MLRRTRTSPAHYYPYPTRRMHDAAKREAIRQFRRALYAGLITRQPCERCGKKRGVEGHHEDYSRPLDVAWLCRVHHGQRHHELRQIALSALALRVPANPGRPTKASAPLAIRAKRAIAANVGLSEGPIREATTRLVEAIELEGVTDTALAQRLGCSRQYVSMIFGGGLRTLKSIVTIADAIGYDVSVVYLKREKVAA